jgi:serine/threonine protein kinase
MHYGQKGSLKSVLKSEKKKQERGQRPMLTEDMQRRILYDVALGLVYLSRSQIIHRDLCPKHVLLDAGYRAMVSEFGVLTSDSLHSGDAIGNIAGSDGILDEDEAKVLAQQRHHFPNMSPEVMERNQYSEKSDVYAFAMLMYELFTLNQPFAGVPVSEMHQKVVVNKERPTMASSSGKAGVILGMGRGVPKDIQDLITICWADDPDQR